MSASMLAGVRVVDLSALLPGPLTTRLLADMGADVVKVESPGGDNIRSFMPGAYEFLNRGKRAVVLDLKDDEDRTVALELIRRADVVVEGFRPGVADRLGVGFDVARSLRPDIVYCSLSSHGQDGPDRDRPGHNIGFEAAGGAHAPTIAMGLDPEQSPIASADVGGAAFAAMAICAALVARASAESPTARHIDLSLEEVIVFSAAPRWGTFLRDGRAPDPATLASYAPGNAIYRTADGRHVALAAVEDKFWNATCDALGRSDLAQPPYDTHAGRMEHRDALHAALAGVIGAHTFGDLLALAGERRLPIEAVRTFEDLTDASHLWERGALRSFGGGVVPDLPFAVDGERSVAAEGLPDPAVDAASIRGELQREAGPT